MEELKNKTSEESRKRWETIERAANEVKNWPAWMRGEESNGSQPQQEAKSNNYNASNKMICD